MALLVVEVFLLKKPPMNGSDDIDDLRITLLVLVGIGTVLVGRVKVENKW